MKQGVLPFHYEDEKSSTGMTAFGVLPAYLDLEQEARPHCLHTCAQRDVAGTGEGQQDKDERFGVIELAVGVDMTPEFNMAAAEGRWKPSKASGDCQAVDLGSRRFVDIDAGGW